MKVLCLIPTTFPATVFPVSTHVTIAAWWIPSTLKHTKSSVNCTIIYLFIRLFIMLQLYLCEHLIYLVCNSKVGGVVNWIQEAALYSFNLVRYIVRSSCAITRQTSNVCYLVLNLHMSINAYTKPETFNSRSGGKDGLRKTEWQFPDIKYCSKIWPLCLFVPHVYAEYLHPLTSNSNHYGSIQPFILKLVCV